MDHDRARLSARRDELRRVIYGTPGGHTSDAVAELVAVEQQLEQLRATHEAATAPPSDAGPVAAKTDDVVVVGDSGSSRRHRGWRRLAFAGTGLLGVGVAVAVALLAAPGLTDEPKGLDVFDRARDDVDAGPRAFVAVLGTDAVATFRSIGRAVGHDVWVFRDDRDVCMIAQRQYRSSWGANCVSETEFRRTGIRQFISYDELGDQARPAELDAASAVELTWNDRSAEVEWSIVPLSRASIDGVWVWVPTEEGSAPMTYEEWSSSGNAARLDGS